MPAIHHPNLETYRSPGYGELYRVRCLCCGWESHDIDPVLNQAAWRRAKSHDCDEED